MALNMLGTMALNMLGTMALNLRIDSAKAISRSMALKSDLDSAKVVNELMALCHEKPRILIITNKDFFFVMLNDTQI